jgi:probable addiction module antidote protein
MNKRKFRTFEEVQLEHYEKHPEELKTYIEVSLDEYQKDSDDKAFLYSLALAVKAAGGFSKLAKHTGFNREHLYRALSRKGDPKFSTVVGILRSLGFTLKVA